jgi:hypothetical protein
MTGRYELSGHPAIPRATRTASPRPPDPNLKVAPYRGVPVVEAADADTDAVGIDRQALGHPDVAEDRLALHRRQGRDRIVAELPGPVPATVPRDGAPDGGLPPAPRTGLHPIPACTGHFGG